MTSRKKAGKKRFQKGTSRNDGRCRGDVSLHFKPFADLGNMASLSGIEPETVGRDFKSDEQLQPSKQMAFGERYGKVNIYLNPFQYPKKLPVKLFFKGRRDYYHEKRIGTLMPLPYDMVVADIDGLRIMDRKQDKAIVYVDEKGKPIKIFGNIPYAIAIEETAGLAGSFWGVHLPVEQDAKQGAFEVVLEEEFDDSSIMDREIEMVKYYWDLPESTPEAGATEVEGYRAAFIDAVRPEKLIDVRDPRLMDDLDESAERYDLRHRLAYTIDSEETKDIDDAVEIVRLDDNRFLLGIHIADVTEFVREDSLRDQNAKNRSTSHYLADRVIHMLPECLSQEYCSLMENKDRLAVSVYVEIEDTGEGYAVRGTRFCRSLIESRAKLSYTGVEGLLKGEGPGIEEAINISLKNARDLAELIASHSPYHDFSFYSGNTKYYEDSEGRILRKDHGLGAADRLIEMFMITANRMVGEKIADMIISTSAKPRGIGMYRVQQTPGEQDLREYTDKLKKARLIPADLAFETMRNEVLKAMGNRRDMAGKLSGAEKDMFLRSGIYREILAHVDQTDPDVGMKLGVLERYAHKPGRLKSKAGLAADYRKSYHHSLGVNRYAWFTSPIRRYADMVNHRQLKAVLSRQALKRPAVDVGGLSKTFNQAGYAAKALDRRLLMYHLCGEYGLCEQKTLTFVVSSFQWAMWYDWAVEIQGVWRQRHTLNFVVEDAGSRSRIADSGLECRLWNGPTLAVGDIITVSVGQTDEPIDPRMGAICGNIHQIAKT